MWAAYAPRHATTPVRDPAELIVLDSSDLFLEVNTCFSQKRYGRVIE
jgi:hypothetical protein